MESALERARDVLRMVASLGGGEEDGGVGRWLDNVLVERREVSCTASCAFWDSRARTGPGLMFTEGERC